MIGVRWLSAAICLIVGGWVTASNELTRDLAAQLIRESPAVSRLLTVLPLHATGFSKGVAQDMWDRSGRILSSGFGRFDSRHQVSGARAEAHYNAHNLMRTDIDVTVTGIADAMFGRGLKQAQFEWQYVELPSIFKRFAANGGDGEAILRLYDDGWRIEEITVRAASEPMPLTQEEHNEERQHIQMVEARRQAEETAQQARVEEARTPTRELAVFEFDEQSAWVYVTGGSQSRRNPIETMVLTDRTIELTLVEFERDYGQMFKSQPCLAIHACLPSGNYTIWLGDLVGYRQGSNSHQFYTYAADKRARLTDRDGELLSHRLIRGSVIVIRWYFDSSEVAEEFLRMLRTSVYLLWEAFPDEVSVTIPWGYPGVIPFVQVGGN